MLKDLWPQTMVRWLFFASGREAAGALLAFPPHLLICSLTLPDGMSGFDIAKILKDENVYSQIPVVLCLTPEEMEAERNWSDLAVDDFFEFPSPVPKIKARLEMVRNRAVRTLDANPLTHLPGNTSIIRCTQGFIEQHKDFAFGYCDLDYFKPFNDAYGFSRGDEVLMMTARVIFNSIQALALPFSFVGHIGGDDFVFIVPVDAAEVACEKIIATFDDIVPRFYDDEDRQNRCIVSIDRKNKPCSFPLMGLSIAVVFNREGSISHYAEASNIAMSLKKKAKMNSSSTYVFDRRSK